EAALRKALELSPGRIDAMWILGSLLMDRGRFDEAERVMASEPYDALRLCGEAILLHRRGRDEQSDQRLPELVARSSETAAYQIAQVHADRRESDAAFEWLRRARRDRDAGLTMLLADPMFVPLHGDPRWREFLAELGLR